MAASFDLRIAIVGSGTIGLSFAALHLSHKSKRVQVIIHDPRSDIEDYVKTTLPGGRFLFLKICCILSFTNALQNTWAPTSPSRNYWNQNNSFYHLSSR